MSAEQSLPTSWIECTLGDVVNYGATQKAEPSEIPNDAWVLELEDIERDSSTVLQRLSFAERQSKSTKSRFSPGDVLYGKLRPYLNKVIRADDAGYCTTEIVPLTPPAELDGGYLFHWLKHPRFLEYVTSVSHGLNMPRLGTDAGRAAPFVLAPLPEQRRIADKLDRLLAQTRACRERLTRVPPILKSFRQSVLAAAASGELTREWREEREREFEWSTVELREVCDSISDGDHQAPPKADSGVPFITISAINTGVLKLDEATRFVPDTYFRSLKPERRAQRGDVLLSVTGSIGITALVDQSVPFVFQRHIALLRPNLKLISSKFLFYRLSADDMRRQGTAVATGTAQLTIPLGGLRSFSFLNPPLDEQDEIDRRLDIFFDLATRLEARCQFGTKQVDALTPGLLAMAFRGELVPQDPTDEPAEALVERLRLSRDSQVKARELKRKDTSGARKKANAGTKMLTRNEISPSYLANLLKEQGALTAEALWSASQLEIDDFYDQLKDEEARGFLRENRGDTTDAPRLLEPVT